MLLNLHVKNLALIEEAEVDFREGLNILTGETGAGKSIIIGSINIALGGKVSKDIIRHGEESALVELVFDTQAEPVKNFFDVNNLDWEDGQIIISRKIMNGKNIIKVNGETISASMLRELAAFLIDIHGQHDNESLLKPSRHLDMLDEYGGTEITRLKKEIGLKYREYRQTKEKADEFCTDEESRRREISFLEFEVNEIEEAQLKPGEDEELEEEYRKMANAEKITSGLGEVYHLMDSDAECVRDQIGRSVKIMGDLMSEDNRIETFYQALSDIESLCNDVTRDLADYMEDLTFREDEFEAVEKRLDFINRLKLKYGKTIPDILNHKEEAEQKLEFYRNFDEEKAETEELLEKQKEELNKMCDVLTEKRHEAAAALQENIVKALRDLNFLEVRFDVEFKKNEGFSANGNDSIQFLISTNPGENLQPLSKVASGGELSRIMLGFKSILAGKDEVETLIFDEIDTGISGRTAQMVSEKLSEISRNHQVICITHLPQIASMADSHYLIEKTVTDGKTTTAIAELTEEKSVEELARMLGGAKITDAVLESAWEMKKMNIYSKKVNKAEKR
ncbi:dNA repair protein RecN [Roseburia sp. CAG:303]|nr:dNA repair protein RecN [Roseburia sp. CAG:303]